MLFLNRAIPRGDARMQGRHMTSKSRIVGCRRRVIVKNSLNRGEEKAVAVRGELPVRPRSPFAPRKYVLSRSEARYRHVTGIRALLRNNVAFRSAKVRSFPERKMTPSCDWHRRTFTQQCRLSLRESAFFRWAKDDTRKRALSRSERQPCGSWRERGFLS